MAEANHGNLRPQVDIFEQLLFTDTTSNAALSNRLSLVKSAKLEFVNGGDDDLFEQWNKAWTYAKPDGLQEHCTRNYLLHGFGAVNIEWGVDEFQNVYPFKFHYAQNRDFVVATPYRNWSATDAKIDELLLRQGPFGYSAERLVTGQWIIMKRGSTRVADSGLMRQGLWLACVRAIRTRLSYSSYADHYGFPEVYIEVADYGDTESLEIAKAIARSIGTDETPIVKKTDGIEVKVIDAIAGTRTAASDLHLRLLQSCNDEIHKMILGATLATDQGSGSSSYALGKEHSLRLLSLGLGDANTFELTFNRDVIEVWAELNGISRSRFPGLPKCLLRISRELDTQAIVEVYKTLQEMGIAISETELLQRIGVSGAKR